jgi:hypothetical protein
MKRFLLALVSLLALSAAVVSAAPALSNEALVIVQGLGLYQDKSGTLEFIEALTIGDKVVLLNRTAKYKLSGTEREYVLVRALSGKEGWARTSYIIPRATLAVVKSDKAIVYSEPRDVKITARYISNMTIVAVLQEGTSASFAKVQCYDIAQNAYFLDSTFITPDNLTAADADVNAAILYTVAGATKDAGVKKNLLNLAATKYSSTVFLPKIQKALGISPAVAKDTAPAAGMYVVNFDKVNVRAAPDEVNGRVVAQLDKGAVVEVTEMTTDSYTIGANTAPWFRIADPDGWVFGASLVQQE